MGERRRRSRTLPPGGTEVRWEGRKWVEKDIIGRGVRSARLEESGGIGKEKGRMEREGKEGNAPCSRLILFGSQF